MGLLNSMFGGGTSLQMTLDNTTASPGAVIGGRLLLVGGKKPLRLTELAVKLFSVRVETKPGQTLPEVNLDEVAKHVVAAGIDLPPMSQHTFNFRITMPYDCELTSRHLTFKLIAGADIPGVKDPTADEAITIVEANEDANRRLPLQEVIARFPHLHSRNEEQLCKALYDLFLACYSEGAALMEVEPLLGQMMVQGTVRVRREALKAWANLVDNRVEPHHLQTLYALANAPGLDDETFDEVIVAATKFAEEGALQLVQQLAQSQSSRVRAEVAQNLRFNAANKFNGKRELLVQLAQDQVPEVRKWAVSALSDFADDQQIVQWLMQIAESDPAPEVQAECISSIQLAHHHGMLELTLGTFERHLGNGNPEVRKQIAQSLSFMPTAAFQRIWGIVQRLAQDGDEDVRRAMAFQFINMREMPQLLPIAQHMAQNDPSPEVRREALGHMSSLMQPQQAAAFYGQLLSQAQSEDDLWTVLNGLRSHSDHPQVKSLLTHMGQLPYPHVADAARDALS